MNPSTLTPRQQLDNLADALVADILALSDEEVLQEFREDYGEDADRLLAETQAILERAIQEARYARARWHQGDTISDAYVYYLRERVQDGGKTLAVVYDFPYRKATWRLHTTNQTGEARGKYAAQRAVRRALKTNKE